MWMNLAGAGAGKYPTQCVACGEGHPLGVGQHPRFSRGVQLPTQIPLRSISIPKPHPTGNCTVHLKDLVRFESNHTTATHTMALHLARRLALAKLCQPLNGALTSASQPAAYLHQSLRLLSSRTRCVHACNELPVLHAECGRVVLDVAAARRRPLPLDSSAR